MITPLQHGSIIYNRKTTIYPGEYYHGIGFACCINVSSQAILCQEKKQVNNTHQ